MEERKEKGEEGWGRGGGSCPQALWHWRGGTH